MARVVLVVARTVVVDLADLLSDLVFGQRIDLHRLLDAELRVCMDEHAHDIRSVPEDVVRAAADEHARTLIGEPLDDLDLIGEQCLVPEVGFRGIVRHRHIAAVTGVQTRDEIALEALIGEQHRVYAAVLGGHGDDLTVVKRDAEPLRQHLAYRLAARAVLPGDRNDIRLHKTNPLFQITRRDKPS